MKPTPKFRENYEV